MPPVDGWSGAAETTVAPAAVDVRSDVTLLHFAKAMGLHDAVAVLAEPLGGSKDSAGKTATEYAQQTGKELDTAP